MNFLRELEFVDSDGDCMEIYPNVNNHAQVENNPNSYQELYIHILSKNISHIVLNEKQVVELYQYIKEFSEKRGINLE